METTTVGESSTSAYAHLSRASAAKAIQQLDSYAFPTRYLPIRAAEKRRRVADVASSPPSRKPSPQFSALAGISHLYRERARQRRSDKIAVDGKKSNPDKGKANAEVAKTYQPFSLPLLLERLSTFSISTYSHKPGSCKNLDPVTLAMQGWYHENIQERDVITCATCKMQWKVQISDKLSYDEQINAWQTLDQSVLSRHDLWCPWRLRRCHPSLFRVPVHGKLDTLHELSEAAKRLALCKDIDQVQVFSDNMSETDLSTLKQALPEDVPTSCILLALLGWILTEAPGPVEGSIVQCNMCARRLGLWNFLPNQPNDRRLDVIKEHKSYCPFINAQTQKGGETSKDSTSHLNLSAWEQRMQVLRSNQSSIQYLILSQHQVRTMRSSESLAKLKSFIK